MAGAGDDPNSVRGQLSANPEEPEAPLPFSGDAARANVKLLVVGQSKTGPVAQ